MKIDVHMHLVGSGCHGSKCWLSPELERRYTVVFMRWLQKISATTVRENLDLPWAERMSGVIADSEVDYGVALGFAGVADSTGELDHKLSQLVVPPAWVFHVCKKYPNLLPGPSVNPNLKYGLQDLEYCIENKAVLIKWLPSVQLIDPSASTLEPFYKLLAESKIPLLIHCGGENTFKSLKPELNSVDRLRSPLEAGVKVICAHSGTRGLGHSGDDGSILRELLEEFEDLYLDNSGMCTPTRYFYVPKLAKDELFSLRTLYGSDWPVPSNAFYYLKNLSWLKVLSLEKEKNVVNRDVGTKRALGYADSSLSAAEKVLANLDYWCK